MTATKPKQPTLPPFESNNVANAKVRITKAGDGLSEALKVEPRAIQLGESVYYVLSGECVQVNHVEKDEVLTRVHTIAADRITEIDAETASKMLQLAAEELERKKSELDGQMSMADEAAALDREALDATGTPADIADAAGKRAKNGG